MHIDGQATSEAVTSIDGPSVARQFELSSAGQVNAMAALFNERIGARHALVSNEGVADFTRIREAKFERWPSEIGVFPVSPALLPTPEEEAEDGGRHCRHRFDRESPSEHFRHPAPRHRGGDG